MKGLIFTWLLTLLGVSSSFINPYYGFLVYVALAILRPDALWSSHISGGKFSLIVAAAMLLNWLVRCCGNWDLGPARRVVLLFLSYWLWSVFLAFQADSPAHAWFYVEQQAKIILPFLVGITAVRTTLDLRKLAWVIVVCQGYVAMELNRWYFSGYNYLWEIGFGSLDNNSMAIGLVTALGVAFFLFFFETSYFRRAVIAGCAAFIGHAILFSFSRGAMLATVVFAGVSFFIIRKTTLHYLVFACSLVIAIFLAGPQVRERFFDTFASNDGGREASAQSRLDLWRDCATLLAEDPILGCGPDHWPLHAHEFGWPAGKEAHSLWVQTAVELGIPGILMYMGFFVVVIWRCWLLLQRTKNEPDAWFADSARMTIASLISFMVAAQFVSLEALEIPYYVAMLGAGSLAVHSRMRQSGDPAESELVPDGFTAESLTTIAAATHEEPAEHTSFPMSRRREDPLDYHQSFLNSPRDIAATEPEFGIPDWRDRIGHASPGATSDRHSLVMN